ncbi:hypothetical protein AALP_AA1G121900 [Arabis alpina]|uniref:DUF674 family protein n=1 Tax=Arabis alpina TaxID=50452 RepID=A0A087HMQ4_ARAAL|nr:hypothetical protein AALP_AA1G121900 [Arabis alpina]
MAGTESSEKQVFKLKLLVDKARKKVVLAEVGKDFVDVLFSFLLRPMGTIVRLLKNQNSQTATTIGCFNNLYKSVVDMGNDDFLTEACKDILVYTRYEKERQCRRLKLNIDDTEDLKLYRCPNLGKSQSCTEAYSIFSSLRCSCGELMAEDIDATVRLDELFVSEKNSFLVTENMEVEFASIVFTMKTLRRLGYKNLDNMEEMFVDVGHKEKRNSCIITRTRNMPSLARQDRAFCLMKKWDTDLDDIEVHVVNISKAEANSLLRASLMTSTALTTALESLLTKKPKEEKL